MRLRAFLSFVPALLAAASVAHAQSTIGRPTSGYGDSVINTAIINRSLTVAGSNTISSALIGNGAVALSSMLIDNTAGANAATESTAAFGISIPVGASGIKLPLYSGALTQSGAASVWGANLLVTVAALTAPPTTAKVQGLEVDTVNNAGYDMNNPTLGYFISGISASLISTVNGGTQYKGWAAFWASGTSYNWNYGFICPNISISLACNADTSASSYDYLDQGVHSYGAYYGGTYGVAPIRLPNATKIVARNAAATVDMSIVATDAANDVLLGAGVTGSIVMGAGTALAATATAGLLELPYMAAAPTGAPAGAAPLCTYNTASHSLDCHDAGGWYHVTLTSGAS